MLNEVRVKHLANRRTAFLRWFLFGAVFASLPISSQAQCSTGWDASGAWEFRQLGQRKPIKLSLEQKGQVLTGIAELPDGRVIPSDMTFKELASLDGTVDGYISGDGFSLHIFWQNGSTGVYSGRILPSGKVEGKGHEKGSPNVQVSWDSVGRLKCPLPKSSSADLRNQSTKTSSLYDGTPKKLEPRPTPGRSEPVSSNAPSPPAPMKVPAIVASQVIYPFRNAPMGTVVLTWDGGPDHPYAEVWFKVNGGQDTFLVEKGKGSIQVPVERYKAYAYILTDAGKTLSTVSFVAQ